VLAPPKLIAVTSRFLPRRCVVPLPPKVTFAPVQAFRLLIPRRLLLLSILPMSSSSSQLFLPPGTPFPVTVVSIQANASDSVQRSSPLLTYSFSSQTSSPGGRPQVLFGIWDCPVEGTIERWCVKERDVITSDEKEVLYISEPCKHGIQMGGLCALCGKDMTECV